MSGRIRTVKPEWLEDELLALASAEARVLSIGLMLLADDYGNGRANRVMLAGQVFPGKPLETLASAIEELQRIRYVTLYEVDGQSYFSIRNWAKHQKVDHPSKPRIPAPSKKPPEALENPRESLEQTRASRGSLVPVQVGDPGTGQGPVDGEEPDEPEEPKPAVPDRPARADEFRAGARLVFQTWKLDTGHHRSELDRKREGRIVARLREGFTPDQLILAIKNRRNDPWLMGETSGRVYDGIDTLLRDRAQVERLLELVAPARSVPRSREIPQPRQPSAGLSVIDNATEVT